MDLMAGFKISACAVLILQVTWYSLISLFMSDFKHCLQSRNVINGTVSFGVYRALLRPGRFDVEVRVFLPDLKGRRDILEHYLSKVKVSADVDIDKMARSTTGCTGADLENMVNQAALKAAMDGDPAVNMVHMEFARDKVLMGIDHTVVYELESSFYRVSTTLEILEISWNLKFLLEMLEISWNFVDAPGKSSQLADFQGLLA